MVVGETSCSCNEIVGNTTAVPPAAVTPRRTDSVRSRNPMLHGVSSLQLEQMPMIGRRRTSSRLNPPARRKARFGHPVMGSANASPVIGVDLPAISARLVIGPPSLGCAQAEAQTEVVKPLASPESSYALLILGGIFVIGIVPPLLMDRLRKPGWKVAGSAPTPEF